jgi:hypothetical protein
VQFNTPVLKNGLLFGLSQRGNLFVSTPALARRHGRTPKGDVEGLARSSMPDQFWLARTSKGQLTVFEPSETQYTELASLKVSDKQTYAYPVMAPGRLFVKDQDSVTLWTIN